MVWYYGEVENRKSEGLGKGEGKRREKKDGD